MILKVRNFQTDAVTAKVQQKWSLHWKELRNSLDDLCLAVSMKVDLISDSLCISYYTNTTFSRKCGWIDEQNSTSCISQETGGQSTMQCTRWWPCCVFDAMFLVQRLTNLHPKCSAEAKGILRTAYNSPAEEIHLVTAHNDAPPIKGLEQKLRGKESSISYFYIRGPD